MSMTARISFLPIFFASLASVFAAAVVVRVHHSATETPASAAARTATSSAANRAQGGPATPARGGVDVNDDPVNTASTMTTAALTTAQQTREQRYRELLAAPAPKGSVKTTPQPKPAATPTPQQPKQSALGRLLAPIVNAFGGGSQASASQSRGSSQPPQTSGKESPRNRGDGSDPNTPKDPNSDSTPPTLISLEFQPPQIQDGQEASILIMATDDISGVRNISGSLSSPSGKALQGFSAQPQPDGQHFIARVVIPKEAESGLWRVNFLTLSDNASNTANLHSSQLPPTAVLRVVSSASDSTPPTLSAVWIDRRSVNTGEKDTLFVRADDDKSGVALVSGVFLSPQKYARIGFGCHVQDDQSWACDVPVPKIADCGDWQLEQIQLQDKANNMAVVRGDNPLVQAIKMNVMGSQCDSTKPVMTSISLSPTAVSNAQPAVIQVTITATDDLSGVRDISGQVMGPSSGGQKPLYFQMSKTADATIFVGHFTVPAKAAKGTWRVVWVSVTDNANNMQPYSTADPVLANAQFTVN